MPGRVTKKNSCPSKTFLLPICLLCACKGRERVFPFFLRLAALCMVLLRRFKIFLGRRISGSQKKDIEGAAINNNDVIRAMTSLLQLSLRNIGGGSCHPCHPCDYPPGSMVKHSTLCNLFSTIYWKMMIKKGRCRMFA